jgi:hypothetical protein
LCDFVDIDFCPTVRAVAPFMQPFRLTGFELPGWDIAFFAFSLFTFVSCQGLTPPGFVVIVGAHNFEIVKQYYLFIILAALILLLAR